MIRLIRPALALACSAMIFASVGRPVESSPVRAAGGLREMSTDRPDTTESPFTIDAGHLQLETDFAVFTRNRLNGVRTTEWVFAPFNLRYGVTPNFEAGIFVVPQVRSTEQPRGAATTTTRGLGDTLVRAKLNLWGNDGGPIGFGILGDVKLPTAANGIGNDKVEGTLTLPVAYEIGAGWEGGAMTAVKYAIVEDGRRRPVWINTLTFARELGAELGMYLELTSVAGDGAHAATFNCGVTRKLNSSLQLDCGANFGLSRNAPDLALFSGVSRRF